jgi:predicted nucleotidyltransferase
VVTCPLSGQKEEIPSVLSVQRQKRRKAGGMNSKNRIIQVLEKEMPFLKSKYRVIKCGLFGSYSLGRAGEGSDIDLLVQFEKPIGFVAFIELENYLSERLGAKVDLVAEDALKPLIKPYVMETIVYV